MSDHIVTFSVLPLSPERTLLRTKWLVHKDAVEGVDYDLENVTSVWVATNKQDGELVGYAQSGARSPAYEPGPYSVHTEMLVEKFSNWYIGRMAAHWHHAASEGRGRDGVMLMIDAPPVYGTAEDAFASQVTRELPGWDAETDDVLVCRLVRDETHDVKTFVFSAREPRLFRYKPGQFLTLDLPIGGQVINRCYTISSAPTRGHLISITVKRVPGGIVSNWLHDTLKPGYELRAVGPLGEFTRLRSPRPQIPVPVRRQRHHAADVDGADVP